MTFNMGEISRNFITPVELVGVLVTYDGNPDDLSNEEYNRTAAEALRRLAGAVETMSDRRVIDLSPLGGFKDGVLKLALPANPKA